jgi:hypothetical protein
MTDSLAGRLRWPLIAGGGLMRQLYHSSSVLFDIVKTRMTSPLGYICTCSIIFAAGTFRGHWLLETLKVTLFKLLDTSKWEPSGLVARHNQPKDDLISDPGEYHYIPLTQITEIRLLRLMPMNPADPFKVNCELCTFNSRKFRVTYVCLIPGGVKPAKRMSFSLMEGASLPHAKCTTCYLT